MSVKREFVAAVETGGARAGAGASLRVLVADGVAGDAAVVETGLRIGDLNGLDNVAVASTRRRLLGG